MRYRTWVEISKKNLLANLSTFKKLAGESKIACVVKANAYGHGIEEVTTLLKGKANLFAVDSHDEAVAVKNISDKPTLILGYIPIFQLEEAIQKGFSLNVYNLESLKKIASYNQKTRIHLKIETGLNRQGIKLADLPKFCAFIKKHENSLQVEGVSTHFANIEDTLDSSFVELQLQNFREALEIVKREGIGAKYIHAAASAATILYSKTHFNLVRTGIGLYGLWPSREAQIAAKTLKKKIDLKPVLSWKSIVAQVKELKTGESVGYGRSWTASRNSKIAVVPVGYYDGFDRNLSNSGRVLIRGKYAPVIGRVAMNMIMIDITEIPKVKLEEEVVIIGKQGKLEISAEEMAEKLGTINYEVISRINPKLPRVIK